MNEIILQRVNKKLSSLPRGKNFAVVLKGVPLNFVEENFREDLEAAKDDPLNYFMRLRSGGRKFFSHEEFLLLNALILMQYDSVVVLNNNLFMEQYPIAAELTDATKKILLEHFTEPEDESASENLGGVAKLADIFIGLKACGNFLVGVYNDEQLLSDRRVQVVNLFDAADEELEKVDLPAAQKFFDLQEETDFVEFVREIIFAQPEKIFVRTKNFAGDKKTLDDRLKILGENFSARTKIFRVRPPKISVPTHRGDYLKILKRYWNYDAFKKFTVYDVQTIHAEEKIARDVSQEEIISDIVGQVELCMGGKDFRDVFVTAPTGSGKSVIFQVAADYLAEKHRLLTIVISPLIALMNDQIKNLYLKNFHRAATIHSDISPTAKDEVIKKVAAGEVDILYVSPETLLSRNDVALLIGDRKIGLFVIDEAHIVTTWGKQFRPDYWYLGDYIKKLRKDYPFIIATFTATAIYGGPEDMYRETLDALHMIDPITYLGYVKRAEIEIKIDHNKTDDDILKTVMNASILKEKTLIYFPWVKLINEEKYKLGNKDRTVAIYHGQLDKFSKQQSYERFGKGNAWVMLATKAFGMGIDIDDIKTVMHFAPTGNVCDYVQEIGRAARARRKDFKRCKAVYHYDAADFRYINILHRLSKIHVYQLVEVIKKICELHRRRGKNNLMLDAENFSYIFGSEDDEQQTINRVKIALLIIRKDLEAKCGFPPITVRPWPLYSKGFFQTDVLTAATIQSKYGKCVDVVNGAKNIFCVNLKKIWEKKFPDTSFPNFKRMIYVRDGALPAELQLLLPVFIANITLKNNHRATFRKIFDAFAAAVKNIYVAKTSVSPEDLSKTFARACGLSEHRAKNICELFFASMRAYSDEPRVIQLHTNDLNVRYSFTYKAKEYFSWFEGKFAQTTDGTFYITDDKKEFIAVLSILEAMGVLSFDITGGLNNQLFVHVNQIGVLERIKSGEKYPNKILKDMERRHKFSVAMLKYIYENNFGSADVWNLLEDYFFGKIPLAVRQQVP
ncbi:MAG: ATP-dependent DNA helicase RecQ [Selenomonadaceae bacterium]|nr:ATP-dependent DNA helicase RecQ [Selenomonadaceae bacterium]MBQ9496215.1 ATP-dependent DNA helicase RecQ [Selenomonadaceae bacterium]